MLDNETFLKMEQNKMRNILRRLKFKRLRSNENTNHKLDQIILIHSDKNPRNSVIPNAHDHCVSRNLIKNPPMILSHSPSS